MIPYARFAVSNLRVIDGDTFVVPLLRCPQLHLCCENAIFRLRGINCEELHDADPVKRALALKAKERVAGLVAPNLGVEIETNGDREKYGRGLARLYVFGVTGSVNDLLVQEGLARVYMAALMEK